MPSSPATARPGIGGPGGQRRAAAGRHGQAPADRAGRPAGPGCLGLQPGRPRADGRLPRCAAGWRPPRIDVARDGHFEVHGLDPETEVPVHFLQPDRKLGATVRLSGKMAAQGPVTVRLEPCGMAMARLVGARRQAGRRTASRYVIATMVVTPGPPAGPRRSRAGALIADEAVLSRVDPVNHGDGLIADAQGRITLPALIPAQLSHHGPHHLVARGAGDGPRSAGIRRRPRRGRRAGRYPHREARES